MLVIASEGLPPMIALFLGNVAEGHGIKLDRQKLVDVLEQLRRSPVGLDNVLRSSVHYGVAFHHAGQYYTLAGSL